MAIKIISDSKDEQISYYKARYDKKYGQAKQFDDSADNDDELFDGLADLKNELNQTIEKDKSDIEKAKKLCLNMKQAVAEVFGHKLSAKNENAEDSNTSHTNVPQASAVQYCIECGTENKADAKFCVKCGNEFF